MKYVLSIILLMFAGYEICRGQFAPDNSADGAEIILHTKTGDIFGTVLLPGSLQKKIPVALIIAGSGPTDRDGNNPMMKNDMYKKLATGLVKHNIATVRYDKRGIAASMEAGISEKDLRFENYVDDARQWIDLLKNDEQFSKVTVIGHSEGSLTGLLAAAESNVDEFISIAGPGRTADELLKEQLSSQPQAVRDYAFPILDSLKNDVVTKNILPMYAALLRESVQPYLISWFKYNPCEAVKKLNIPILILQGTNDAQVKISDAELLHKANPASKLILFENVNHILRKITGNTEANIASYGNSLLPIDNELINRVAEFILSN